jgi:hypothetical protein
MEYYFDYTKSLSELEGKPMEKPDFNSHLVQTCYELYNNKPVGNYTVEDLRIMIGQDIGLLYLIPLALEELERNPFVSGDLFEADLLKNVLESDKSFWRENTELKNRAESIIQDSIDILSKSLSDFKNYVER